MKRFFFWLIRPWVRSLLGLSLLSLFVWFEGPLLVYNGKALFSLAGVRWACIGLLFLGWIVCFSRAVITIKFADSRSAKGNATDHPIQSQPECKALDPATSILSKRMKDVKDALKKAGRVSGRSTRLPWYLVIGAPGAGKTTALLQSGLKFPLPKTQAGTAVGGAGECDDVCQCDWRLTDDAVFLDTPGRYATHDNDREADRLAWGGFLRMIRKYRRRRPINGVIVVLNVTDLLKNSDSALHIQALAIRQRIKELHEQLGIRFPVYVVLTKCDLLTGFSEFFDNLGREERNQVWGVTFPLTDSDQITLTADRVLSQFPDEFHRLEKQLQCRILDRMQQEHDVQRRALIYHFPQQFAAVADVLHHFLMRAFESSRYEVNAMLRGVYFTSATQQGKPIDFVMGRLSERFSLKQKMAMPSVAGLKNASRSYFVTRLLRDIVIAEAELASGNLRFERHRHRLHWWVLAVIGLVLVVGSAGLIASYLSNQSEVREVSQRSAELETRAQAIFSQDGLVTILPFLNAAHDLSGCEADRDKHAPFLTRLGLFQREKLDANVLQLYRRLRNDMLLPHIVGRMEAELRQGSANNADYLFETLRAYLMLDDRARFDAESVLAWIEVDLGRNPPAIDSELRHVLSHQVAELLRQPDALHTKARLDDGLIERARLILAGIPLKHRIYRRLTQELARSDLPAFNIAAAGGRDAHQVFTRKSGQSLSQGVAGMYTRAGYKQWMAQVDSSITDMLKESWVLNRSKRLAGTDDWQQTKMALQHLYFDDYIQQWEGMLADVTIVPIVSLDHAARITTVLSATDSPLRKLLQEAARQTTLGDLKPIKIIPDFIPHAAKEKFEAAKQKLASILVMNPDDVLQRDAKSMNPVDAHFDALHQLVGVPGTAAASPLDQVLGKMKDATVYFNAARSATESGISVPASDVLNNLTREAIGKPGPLAAILQDIDKSGAVLALGSERARLNALWAGSVLPFCRRAIANRYPLVRSATLEITLDDFGQFFGPAGMMDDFFQKNLRPYVDMSGVKWRWRFANHVPPGMPQKTLDEFQRAAIIRERFFHTDEKQVSMHFDLNPISMDTHFAKVLFEIEGQTLTYEQNAPSRPTSFQIPSAIGSSVTRLATFPSNGNPEMQTKGPWAWFRMTDLGILEASAQGERFKLRFDLGGKKMVFDLTASSVNNPFKRDIWEQFNCLDRL